MHGNTKLKKKMKEWVNKKQHRRMVWGYKGTETEIQGKKCAIMHGRKKVKWMRNEK